MAQWYWILLEQSANFAEALMLIILLQQFFYPKYAHRWISVVTTVGIYLVIYCLNLLQWGAAFNIVVYLAIGITLGMTLYEGSFISRILVPLLMVALIMISELVTMGLLRVVFGVDDEQFTHSTSYRMVGIIISKVFLIALVYISGRISKKKYTTIPLIYNLCLLIVPLISVACLLTISQYVLGFETNILSPLWFTVSAIGLLFVNLLIIYLFEAFMKYSSNQSKYQLMIQQADMLSKHLRETNTMQEETHRIWHDMKNHFTVIQWMVKSKNYDKLEKYMQTLNDTVADTMLKVQSGNTILDALLNPKFSEAKKLGIDMTINASVPSGISVDDIDLNIVYSNALDNAMEACKKIPDDSNRFISVDTYIRNDHLVLTVKNSFNGVIKTSGNDLKTTKLESGRHGIGMGNMKRTVEKYDGHIMTNIEERVFILTAVMYCRITTEKAV